MSDNFFNNLFAPAYISPNEKVLRDVFVQEYLKDYDELQACLRVGFQFSFAQEFSRKFMQEPYVQQKIAEYQRKDSQTTESDKALVLNVLREAAQRGPYASRVAAAAKLAAILGLDNAAPADNETDKLIQAFKEFSEKAPV